jgi:large subunit ribosomal protein L31
MTGGLAVFDLVVPCQGSPHLFQDVPMKTGIHPEYHTDAVVKCLCGNTFTTGSTLTELKTEVCSVCHPFFTGTQRIVDTGGQVERFRRRAQKAASGRA